MVKIHVYDEDWITKKFRIQFVDPESHKDVIHCVTWLINCLFTDG